MPVWGLLNYIATELMAAVAGTGAAPLFLSERALQKILDRKTKPATYAMELNLIGDYWGA